LSKELDIVSVNKILKWFLKVGPILLAQIKEKDNQLKELSKVDTIKQRVSDLENRYSNLSKRFATREIEFIEVSDDLDL